MSRREPWLAIVLAGTLAGAQGGRVERGGPPPDEAPAALQVALDRAGCACHDGSSAVVKVKTVP